ncbi:MAG: hypothetical protein V2A66_02600 [Pseudomonadota bacterium]
MKRFLHIGRKAAILVFFAFIFVAFFNGYKSGGPARGKFKHLGESEVDLTRQKEEAPEVNKVVEISGDKKVKAWAAWWKKCVSNFSLDTMEDIGQSQIYDEDIPMLSPEQMGEGPGRMFYLKSPDGKRRLNPYWGRLLYKKEGDAWQPYIEIPCGVALYTPSEKRARKILDCSALEGVDDAYWRGKDTIVLMGYSAISRQMSVECETVESCIAPTIWTIDIKTSSMNEQRGPVTKRKSCDLGGYLKIRLPGFFGKEK